MDTVRDLVSKKHKTISELIKDFSAVGGFTAADLSKAFRICREMYSGQTTVFFSFPACVVATGLRGLLKEFVKLGFADVVITTCGTLDHDLARVWGDYLCGSFSSDDTELAESGIHRVGNVFVPSEVYGPMLEKKISGMLEFDEPVPTYELVWKLGREISSEPKAEESIVYWCWKKKVPVIIPAITDGAIGSFLWSKWEEKRKPLIDVFADEHMLSDIVFNSKSTGAVVIGGGVSKHHTIWWNQFCGGLDFAVYLSTADERDGSLSGAPPREAISWKKIKPEARYALVKADATVTFPLLFYSLVDEFPGGRK
ncbi:MAG: deoxyhypusine synthase [Candidatus Micrarchaeota archaeon]|nr:deoxyhypusine synthase [Candidatus Micrarchaeota archaeon]